MAEKVTARGRDVGGTLSDAIATATVCRCASTIVELAAASPCHPVENIRVVLTDGASHAVDSSELAFKLAALYAFRQCYAAVRPVILEPIMLVELKAPTEFQGPITGDINRRKGMIVGNDQDGDECVITAHVPLNNMFGYSTALRSMTQGKGEFTMEYREHSPVSQDVQLQLVNSYKKEKGVE